MIEIQHLSKIYPNREIEVLNNINLSIERGKIFGIIGESGAGKSTLLHCINLMERPTQGSIKINGVEITTLSGKALRDERKKIGIIFQEFNLLSSKTVFENIALPLRLTKMDKAQINERVLKLLDIVGLADRQNAYPAELSGGQKQRVAIARALANQPDVLLCDEATSALDPQNTQIILDLLKSINEQFNLTIILITHQMDVVKKICDQVAILHHGVIVELGDVLPIFTNPKHPYTKELTKSSLKLDLPENINVLIEQADPHSAQYTLMRFTFVGNNASQPFLSELTEKFHVRCSVLQANIELIHGKPMGIMLVQLQASSEQVKQIIDFSTHQDLHAEVIGYVN